MKQILVIIAACLIFISSMKEVSIYMDYYANLDYIVSKLCINRDKPSMKCNGKCYLKDKLADQEQNEQKNTDKRRGELKLTYFIEHNIQEANFAEQGKKKRTSIQFQSHHFSSEWHNITFRPPIVS